jgi:tRNA (guanine37-N1)-methyltransferase
MGKEASATEESFSEGILEYPQFTRPQLLEDRAVPEVLLSGDHAKVRAWRRQEAERLTRERRPDLWAAQDAAQDDNARAPVNAKAKPNERSDSRNKGSTEG